MIMAWFPWTKLPQRVLPATELIDWLRYRAIDFGAPPAFVDAIDDLRALGDDDRMEKLAEALENLVGAAKCFLDDPDAKEGLERALTAADEVL